MTHEEKRAAFIAAVAFPGLGEAGEMLEAHGQGNEYHMLSHKPAGDK